MPPALAANATPAIVVSSAVVANANDPNKNIDFPANHPLVQQTAFLGYMDVPATGAGAVTTKQLATFQAIRAFGRRCQLAQNIPAALSLSVYNLALTGGAWSRILQELVTSGLLSCTFGSLAELEDAIDGLTIVTATNLEISRLDLDLGEGTDTVAAVAPVPPVRAAGRRGSPGRVEAVPGVAGVPGRAALAPELLFLDDSLLPLQALELTDESPWANIAYLIGALGPCLTQTARNTAGSARLTASALAVGLSKYLNIPAGNNALLAGELPGFLTMLRTRLPLPMRCLGVNLSDLRTELRDTILYGQSKEDRVRIETQRLHYVANRFGASGCNHGQPWLARLALRPLPLQPWLKPRLAGPASPKPVALAG